MHYGSRRYSYVQALLRSILLLLIVATLGHAQPKTTVVSAVSPEFANGLNARIIKEVVNRLGFDLDLKYVSFARKLVLLEQGRIEISSGLHRTAERETFIRYIDPPYLKFSGKYFFLKKGSPVKLETYDDLYRLRVATSIDSKYFDKFDNDDQIKKVKVSKVEQKFKMLEKGRVDVVIHTYAGAMDILERLGLQDKIVVAEYRYLVEDAIYIGVSKHSHLMSHVDEIEALVHDMVRDGEFGRIIDEHYFSIESALE
jgi:polar amino acid transport system substrate-binding protein